MVYCLGFRPGLVQHYHHRPPKSSTFLAERKKAHSWNHIHSHLTASALTRRQILNSCVWVACGSVGRRRSVRGSDRRDGLGSFQVRSWRASWGPQRRPAATANFHVHRRTCYQSSCTILPDPWMDTCHTSSDFVERGAGRQSSCLAVVFPGAIPSPSGLRSSS